MVGSVAFAECFTQKYCVVSVWRGLSIEQSKFTS